MTKAVFFVFLSVAVAVLSPFCRASSERMNQPQALAPSRIDSDRENDALANLLLHVLTQRSIPPNYSSYQHWSGLMGSPHMPSQLKKKESWNRYRIGSRVPAFGSFFSPAPSDNSQTSKVFRYG